VQEGLKRSPNSAFGQFLLGSIYKGLGKLTDAEHALHEALQIDPSMSRVHLELVNLYLSQRKKSEASLELKAFLKDSPNDPLAAKAREMLDKLDANP
jgi:predicted Zn-dependent protease